MSVLRMHQQKRSDCTLENLIVFSETVSAIATDIQGFKTIRSRLFAHASHDQGEGKLYLYLFHLFESLVANVSTLINKTQSQLVAQCPESVLKNLNRESQGAKKKEAPILGEQASPVKHYRVNDTTKEESYLSEEPADKASKDGFFADNFRSLLKAQREIEEVVELLNRDQQSTTKAFSRQRSTLNEFLRELQSQTHLDNSFEVRWSLQELENIVYDFVNGRQGLPNEFKSTLQMPLEARIEEIMMIQKRENDKDEMLPAFVRELILQDRGNSLYLSDSFANLPSPVNETQDLK